ncbi:MAG TPA: alpha/beta fold hydrolase [Aggregatilineales bacterium]|nr:alpha/beta fold hydrolase [Aggregatilineales bacterium]
MNGRDWVDRTLYPFESHFQDTPAGTMHYVDVGRGEPIVFAHGNPTWSFMYRELIKGLCNDYRCVAPDYIGFGLSDKPSHWSYRPRDHAAHFAALINSLNMKDITLAVHDWGGPIALSYAIEHPSVVKRLIIFNSFLWELNDKGFAPQFFSRVMGGPIGRYLCMRHNFFANTIMKRGVSDPSHLPPHIHEHYLKPFDDPKSRRGTWVFPRELLASRKWLASLWARRDALSDKPALIVWGMSDRAFKKADLERWQTMLPRNSLVWAETGHFVPEEMGARLVPEIRTFMEHNK